MTLWKTGALAGALLVAAAAGAAWTPIVHGKGEEPQRWEHDSDNLQDLLQVVGRSGQIGVSVRDVDDSATGPAKTGVLVDDVREASPAAKAGIKNGDEIVEFDGERVRSVRQFTRLVQDTPVGRKVPLVVVRGGQRVTLTVAPERGSGWASDDDFAWVMPPEPPTPPAAPKAPLPPRPPQPFFDGFPEFGFSYRAGGGGRLGVSLEDLSDGLGEYFGVKHGVLVRSVTDGSAAAKAGIKAGDVITSVNGTAVEQPSDVRRALDRLDDQADLTIEIMRDKKPQTLKGKLEPRRGGQSRAIV